MKKIFALLLSVILSSGLISSQIAIKGSIIDSKTNLGIEYASIYKEGTNIGCISDLDGNFVLNKLKALPDSLTISCVGYENKKIYKSDIDTSINIKINLELKLISLNEVTIKTDKLKEKTELLGSGKRNWFCYSPLYYASQNMRYFKGENYPSYILGFSFYIGEINGNKKARVRVYDVDSLKGTPHNDILNVNLIATDLKKGWNKIDLSKYRLLVPKEGFFIGLESIVIDEDC